MKQEEAKRKILKQRGRGGGLKDEGEAGGGHRVLNGANGRVRRKPFGICKNQREREGGLEDEREAIEDKTQSQRKREGKWLTRLMLHG